MAVRFGLVLESLGEEIYAPPTQADLPGEVEPATDEFRLSPGSPGR